MTYLEEKFKEKWDSFSDLNKVRYRVCNISVEIQLATAFILGALMLICVGIYFITDSGEFLLITLGLLLWCLMIFYSGFREKDKNIKYFAEKVSVKGGKRK